MIRTRTFITPESASTTQQHERHRGEPAGREARVPAPGGEMGHDGGEAAHPHGGSEHVQQQAVGGDVVVAAAGRVPGEREREQPGERDAETDHGGAPAEDEAGEPRGRRGRRAR